MRPDSEAPSGDTDPNTDRPETPAEDPDTDTDSDTDSESSEAPPAGLDRDSFIKAYGRDSADQADAVIDKSADKYVPATGFHATRGDYVNGIVNSGLDPTLGGTGASAAAARLDPQAEQFQNNSVGSVHYTSNLQSADEYRGFLAANPDEYTTNDATVLGVNREGSAPMGGTLREALDLAGDNPGAGKDPDDRRQAVRTTEPIPPENITTGLNATLDTTRQLGPWEPTLENGGLVAMDTSPDNFTQTTGPAAVMNTGNQDVTMDDADADADADTDTDTDADGDTNMDPSPGY